MEDRSPWSVLVLIGLCIVSCSIGISMGRNMNLNLTQQEVTLGDGTKATCVIVHDAGVTCIPHVVVGPDAEEDRP